VEFLFSVYVMNLLQVNKNAIETILLGLQTQVVQNKG